MMNFDEILKNTAFSTIDITVDGVTFRIGVTDKMPSLLGLSLVDVTYGDGAKLGGIIIAISDVERYLQTYGEGFTRKFFTFVVAHEVGHLVDFKNDPPKFGGLTVSLDREAEADAWALSNTKTGIYLYRKFMSILKDEFDKFNENTPKAAAAVGIVNKIDDFNYNRRIKAAIRKAKPGNNISQEVTEIVDFVIGVTKRTYSK